MKYSILNLVPLRDGQTFKEAIDNMVRLAKKAEELGYERYWLAEHHNMKSVASSATKQLIQHTLANTSTLRVGSGGIMLPNHSPYLIAEEFGMLETLYPNRVDLGLGRAPGTDMQTAQALRRDDDRTMDFPEEVEELQGYFKGTESINAYPAKGLDVPFYILGSSIQSAYLAAKLGLPYSFAAHFAPAMMVEAINTYRRNFQPSDDLAQPYVILGANAIVADTDEEAKFLATTQTQSFLNIVTGQQRGLMPPVEDERQIYENLISVRQVPHFGPVKFDIDELFQNEKAMVKNMSAISLIGSKETVKQQLQKLQSIVEFDEIMCNSYIYDEAKQHHSYELLAEAIQEVK